MPVLSRAEGMRGVTWFTCRDFIHIFSSLIEGEEKMSLPRKQAG